MILKKHNNKGFIGIAETVVVVLIIAMVAYFLLKKSFRSPVDARTKESLSEQGIDASNYKTIIESTRARVEAIQKQAEQQQRRMEDSAR
jgi:hypothetical protein